MRSVLLFGQLLLSTNSILFGELVFESQRSRLGFLVRLIVFRGIILLVLIFILLGRKIGALREGLITVTGFYVNHLNWMGP